LEIDLPRKTRPGQHGGNRTKPTQFALRLNEKQKIRFFYGISEKAMVKAVVSSKGSTNRTLGERILEKLNCRVDNVLFTIGYGSSLNQRRQIVNHGLVSVDGNKVSIPSFTCSPGSLISVRDAPVGKFEIPSSAHKTEFFMPLVLEYYGKRG